MPSHLVNRIAQDCGVDIDKVEGWFLKAQAFVDQKGWSPNESRYWSTVHRLVQRKIAQDGCKKIQQGNTGAQSSRALQGLLKAIMSEYESEAHGLNLS